MDVSQTGQTDRRYFRSFSELHASILRMTETLDLDYVLNVAVESACTLTQARYGVIVHINAAGVPVNFFTCGITPEERQQLVDWPGGPALLEHLSGLGETVRIPDLPGTVRALDIGENRTLGTSLMVAPLNCGGEQVGSFFIADKLDGGGGTFTDADAEVLTLLATPAAAAIANARTHSAEHRLRREFESLFDIAPVGVVRIDMTTGCTVSLNREAKRIASLLADTADELSGMELRALACRRSDGTTIPMGELCLQLAKAETGRSEEVTFAPAGEITLNALVGAAEVVDDNGGRSMVLTVQDLTPFDRLDRMRSQFMATVAHELRTPLTAIRGAADTLLTEEEDLSRAEMREFFRIMAAQASHMRRLIGDLLDSGSIQAGALSVSLERCRPGELVEQARKLFERGNSQQAIRIDLPPDLPLVMADYRRIVQVLGNLLANAARHAPDNTQITIAAELKGQHVAVSVADQGTGIAPERLPKVFRRHHPLADGPAASTGLGLAICKGLVEAHGGRIWADSPGPGRGATFTFTLPVAEVPADAGGDPAQEALELRDPARILVVDDDPLALRFARDTLQAEGHSVFMTGDPGDLPQLLRTGKPHLALLDLALPGTDAVELMQQTPGLAGVPVIIVSGYGREETIAKALDGGAEDYIVKPCSPTELQARVRLALRRARQPDTFQLGRLAIDYRSRRASLDGQAIELTATEYELLAALAQHSGTVVTYDKLMRQVWKRGEADPNLVRMHVSNLRRKLGDRGEEPVWIFNERAVGYRMAGSDDQGHR